MLSRALLLTVLTLWLAAGPGIGFAGDPTENQPRPTGEILDRWDVEASSVEILLDQDPPGADEITELTDMLEVHLEKAPKLVTIADGLIEPLRAQLKALGPKPDGSGSESTPVAEERKALLAKLARIESMQKRASQAEVRARSLLERLADRRRELFTKELVERGPTLVQAGVIEHAFASILDISRRLLRESGRKLRHPGMGWDATANILGLAALTIFGLVFLTRGRRKVIRRLLAGLDDTTPHSRRVTIALGITIARLVVPALSVAMVIAAVWSTGVLGYYGFLILRGVAGAAGLVIVAYALGGVYYAPRAPQLRFSALDDARAAKAHRRIVRLAVVVGLDSVLVVQGEAIGLSVEALTLINSVLLILGGAALWSLVQAISGNPPSGESTDALPPDATAEDELDEAEADAGDGSEAELLSGFYWAARNLMLFAAVAAPLLALAGYYAASRYAFYPLVASAAVIGFCILLFHALRELVERIANDETARTRVAERHNVRLIPIIVGFLMFCATLPVLALIWGATLEDLRAVWRGAVSGFQIGEFIVSPVDFLVFIVVFSIGFVLTRVAQRVLSTSILPLTRLDTGGRAAAKAGVGYLGITIAALVAISTTSLNLSNLAIVAGALSVGIGFGLQNIVNNFVSGVILLIERPIKAGDWVELPSGMGYVKQINVRSTEIETFDRSSLIVPNSELISSTVINWTHGNMHGRIIIPIGVAYGTDTRKVESVLLEIAKAHPMLLRRPAPWILFKGFGDSSLDFEIRGVLRDINWIMNVKTDLNHEIARRFSEEGIEIPFPQRDLHLRTSETVPVNLRDGNEHRTKGSADGTATDDAKGQEGKQE